MKDTYKNKMVKPRNKTVVMVPVYIGPPRYFKKYRRVVNEGEQLPDFPLKEATSRPDFKLLKKEK